MTFLALTTLQVGLVVAGLALALILGWKMFKLAVKVVILGALLLGVYFLGTTAGWWDPLF